MKIAYILAVLLVVFMVGCATTPADTTPAETVEEAAAEEAAAEEAAAPIGADVTFNGAGGFDPEEITIAAGSTVNVLVNAPESAKYSFVIQGTTARSTQVEDGEIAELAFEEAGAYTVMSIPLMKRMTVTVE